MLFTLLTSHSTLHDFTFLLFYLFTFYDINSLLLRLTIQFLTVDGVPILPSIQGGVGGGSVNVRRRVVAQELNAINLQSGIGCEVWANANPTMRRAVISKTIFFMLC